MFCGLGVAAGEKPYKVFSGGGGQAFDDREFFFRDVVTGDGCGVGNSS